MSDYQIAYSTEEWDQQHRSAPEQGTLYSQDGMDVWKFSVTVQSILSRNPTVHKMTMSGSYDVVKAAAIGAGVAFAQMLDVKEVVVSLLP